MVDDILIIGANSDLAKAVIKNLDKSYNNIHLVSRNEIISTDHCSYVIDDYLESLEKIKEIVIKNKIKEIIIFNGVIFETSIDKYITNFEIKKTIEINFLIPSSIITSLNTVFEDIRYSVISSIAASKLRQKNYFYGISKQALEDFIRSQNKGYYFIFRSGFIFTKMTEIHNPPPYTQTIEEVATSFGYQFSNLKNKKIEYGYSSKYIQVLFLIFRFLPSRLLNYIEKKVT